MKRLVVAWIAMAAMGAVAPAVAADMPVKAVAKAPPPAVLWTGCYVGGNIGAGWADKRYTDPLFVPPDPFDLGRHSPSGWVGGGQVGCDYQSGIWVFGVQGMFQAANLTDRHDSVDRFVTRIPWLATATARLGIAVQPNTLIYVKGGAAWVRDNEDIFDLVTGLREATASVTRTGWVVGVGGEIMAWSNLSVFAEFNYLDFGNRNVTFTNLEIPPVPPTFPLTIRQNVWTIMTGINYRFGGGAVVAKY
jgi:outer membrane immunogenic protein